MARRRIAIAGLVIVVALAASGCSFSRSNDDAENAANTETTTAETLATLGDDTSTSTGDTSTTVAGATSSTRRTATTVRAATATTRAPAPRVVTTRAPASPHCNVSVADTFYGSSWTANVGSTFPNAPVTIDIRWPGGSGNYSGYTDPGGSWSKTQRAQPSMRGQRVTVNATVASVRCSTSFTVS